MEGKRPLVIFVVGPTATGKSDFAVEAAIAVRGEILNTDSVQVYATVDIGTAKPPPEQMARVPHHLFSYVPENATSTAGEFRREAIAALERRAAAGTDVFFAVGGSGFYVQALEKGMYPAPEVPSEIRQSVEHDRDTKGLAALYEELRARDPLYAGEISANDSYRIKRALEIVRVLQGPQIPHVPPSVEQTWTGIRERFGRESEVSRPFDVLKVGIIRPRPLIRKSVETRTRAMIERGLVDEVRSLRARGLGTWAPMLSVGYKETQDFLDGLLPEEKLEAEIVTSTMQLVKRQTTWFRRDSVTSNPISHEVPAVLSGGTYWFDAEQGWDDPLRFVRDSVAAWRAGALTHPPLPSKDGSL